MISYLEPNTGSASGPTWLDGIDRCVDRVLICYRRRWRLRSVCEMIQRSSSTKDRFQKDHKDVTVQVHLVEGEWDPW